MLAFRMRSSKNASMFTCTPISGSVRHCQSETMNALQTCNTCGTSIDTSPHFERRPLRILQLESCQRWACALETQRNRRPASLRSPVLAAVVSERAKAVERIPTLPFVKIAGQEDMKLAILLNVIDPKIGGVLIMGDRGTGKSLAVSADTFCMWNF